MTEELLEAILERPKIKEYVGDSDVDIYFTGKIINIVKRDKENGKIN